MDVFISGQNVNTRPETPTAAYTKFHHDTLLRILSYFTHQFDGLLQVSNSVCRVLNCTCDQHDVPELLITDELATDLVRRLAQILGEFLYTSEVVGAIFALILNEIGVPISTVEWAMSSYKFLLDARATAESFSPILVSIVKENWNVVRTFAKHGADLHYLGNDIEYSPVKETATSLALYSSRSFFEWRAILRDLKVDIRGFIIDELKLGQLSIDGWNAETLQLLFELEFSPVERHNNCMYCECGCLHDYSSSSSNGQDEREDNSVIDEDDVDSDGSSNYNENCCGEAFGIMVEVSWQTLLGKIKYNSSLAGYIERYSKYSIPESKFQEISDSDRQAIQFPHENGKDDVMGGTNNNSSESTEQGRDVGKVHDTIVDDGASSVTTRSQNEGHRNEEQKNEDLRHDGKRNYEKEWFCVRCWYDKCLSSSTSSSTLPASEAGSNDDESPMLLNIDI